MLVPQWLIWFGYIIVALIVGSVCVWVIIRAIRPRHPELFIARCRKCKYPVPAPGPTAICPECGADLAGHGTLAPPSTIDAPPRRFPLVVACIALVSILRPFLNESANALFPRVIFSNSALHHTYQAHYRRGYTPPRIAYHPIIDLDTYGPAVGAPESGTLTVRLDGDLPVWPSAVLDIVSARIIRTSHLPPSLVGSSDIAATVKALYLAAGMDLSDPDEKAHAAQLVNIIESYRRRPGGIGTRPEEDCNNVPMAGCLTPGDSSASYSYETPFRIVLGQRHDPAFIEWTITAIQLFLLIPLAIGVAWAYQRARTIEHRTTTLHTSAA